MIEPTNHKVSFSVERASLTCIHCCELFVDNDVSELMCTDGFSGQSIIPMPIYLPFKQLLHTWRVVEVQKASQKEVVKSQDGIATTFENSMPGGPSEEAFFTGGTPSASSHMSSNEPKLAPTSDFPERSTDHGK
ncbi:hypothetical protein JD844_015633 [Phrynosoma platyrhinos]|uniref:Uncharacterized protein n=1 Tax=Phrynosoma platyrhinos TaxID=52577 RepID=A0ABQ7SJD4_PHRPL|nr:hypothetical protein JD844_015633 [Phrynosoma platyrhinos]